MINLKLEGDFSRACATDDIKHAANYKTVTKNVIKHVERSEYFLVEKLADQVATICLKDKAVRRVTVTLDKPGALRFARSVAVEFVRERK